MSAGDYYKQDNAAESSNQNQYNGKQPYPQQPPQYSQTYDANSYDPNGEKVGFNQAFRIEKPRWNDLWAGILVRTLSFHSGKHSLIPSQFLIVFFGFAAVSGISLNGYASTKGFNGGGIYGSSNDFGLTTNTIVLFAFCLVVAIVLSYGYVSLARVFTKQFIWITGILNIVFGLVTAIYMLSRKYYSGGVVFLLFSIFAIICFVSWIPRIPFSVVMLQTSIDVSKSYGHVYLVSFLGGLLATAFGAWYSVTLVAVYIKYEPGANPACSTGAGSCSSATVIGLLVFITFAMYWVSEVLKNTIHTTISGVYGSWYFCVRNPPHGATRGALRRSLTYSFGSISLGSLIVAIINCLRQACSVAQQSSAQDGNILGSVLFCVLGCLISVLDWVATFINRYAFSYISLYGKPYFAAAKATWGMMRDRGLDALVNECLVGPVLTLGATFVAYVCALLAYLYVIFTSPAYNSQGQYTAVIVAFAFLIGLQIANIFTTPLASGIDTIFVSAAFDPEVMIRDHPDLYDRMIAAYPHVQVAIHA